MPTVTKHSRARIRTSKGDLLLQFLPDKAPRTVENFVLLAHKGFYDGLTFHRILKDFVVQGGCPKGDGSSGPGYTIRPEFNDTPHEKGVVSMARNNDPHSAGSQFFICTAPVRYLDSRYSAFARVVEGLDVLDGIAASKVHDGNRWKERSTPLDPVYIHGVDLLEVEFESEGARSEAAESGEDGAAMEVAEPAPSTSKGRGRRRKEPAAAADGDAANGNTAESAESEAGGEAERERRPRRRPGRPKKAKNDEE